LSDAAKIHTYVNKNETVFPLFKAVLLFNIFSDFIIGRFGVCSMYCKHGDFKQSLTEPVLVLVVSNMQGTVFHDSKRFQI